LRRIASKREKEQEARESKERAAQCEVEQEAANARWWQAYEIYLQSPAWKTKRRLVMQRAEGICEGCRQDKATEVHHLWYPGGWKREILPGAEEWVRAEKLFHLVALCPACHADIHGKPDS
jgi:5-methylcytosine-specific restriction endonuclease McrA